MSNLGEKGAPVFPGFSHRVATAIVALIAVVCMFGFLNVSDDSDAATSGDTGKCTWSLSDSGDLTISGNGAMADYSGSSVPWSECKTVTINEGVTSIGKNAFNGCTSLTSVFISKTVTSIGTNAFFGCTSLTDFAVAGDNPAYCSADGVLYTKDMSTLVQYPAAKEGSSYYLPDAVTSVLDRALIGCASVSEIRVGDGNEAFCSVDGVLYSKDKTALVQYPLGRDGSTYQVIDGVTSIGSYAFYGCTSLVAVVLPSGLQTIGDHAFYGCSSLASMGLPLTVTQISPYTFYNCTSLTSVVLSDFATSIGDCAFYGCSKLETLSMTANNTVAAIGSHAFDGCSSLESLPLSSKLTNLGAYAFQNCSSLTEVAIPSGLSSIERNTFYGCSSLRTLDLSNATSLYSIWSFAFLGCSSLTGIDLPSGLRVICPQAFAGCTSVTYLSIPSSVTVFGVGAFQNLTSLETLHLGANLIDLIEDETESEEDEGVFATSWSDVFKFTNPSSARYFYDENCDLYPSDGVLPAGDYTLVGKSLYYHRLGTTGSCSWELYRCTLHIYGDGAMVDYTEAGPWGTRITSVTIDTGVTYIGKYAFESCTELVSVSLPRTLIGIGESAFYKCSDISSFKLTGKADSAVTCSIGRMAFYGCTRMTSVELPANTVSIGYAAFYGCSGLNQVTCAQASNALSVSIGNRSFEGCSQLVTFTMPGFFASIGDNAFDECTSLKSVSISRGITAVGDKAFSACHELSSISTMVSVTSIGEYAFYNCGKLTSVTLGTGLLSIGNNAFDGCSSLESPMDLQSVTAIGNYAFDNCAKIPSVSFGDSLSSLGKCAFNGCSSIASIELKGDVGTIGDYTFSGCSLATSIILSGNVTSIGLRAFSGCSSVQSIYIASDVTDYGKEVFAGCGKVSNLHIGGDILSWSRVFNGSDSSSTMYLYDQNGVQLGDAATMPAGDYSSLEDANHLYYRMVGTTGDCTWELFFNELVVYGTGSMADYDSVGPWGTAVTSVTFYGTKHIGDYAFSGCTALAEVDISVYGSSDALSIGAHAFEGCPAITDVRLPEYLASIGDYAFAGCSGLTVSSAFSDEYGVECQIGAHAFEGCSSILYFEVPVNTAVIGDYAFAGCTGLTSLMLYGDVRSIGAHAFDGCISLTSVGSYDYDGSSAGGIGDYAFNGCSSLKAVSLPSGICSVGSYAFCGCAFLEDFVVIGSEGAGTIGDHAFERCMSLRTVSMTPNITSIGDYAFNQCSALSSLPKWSSLTAIGNSAFYQCYALACDFDLGKAETIGAHAFCECEKLKSVTFGDSLTSIGGYAFVACTSLKSVEIPSSVTSIGEEVFFHCTSLATVTFPDTLRSIGSSAFAECYKLRSVIFPSGLTSIGGYAFGGCTSIESIEVPSGIQYIDAFTFSGCTSLKSVKIPDSVTEIYTQAFADCSSLTDFEFTNGLKVIYAEAFCDCTSLRVVSFGDSFEKLYMDAFSGCTGLTEVHLAKELEGWADGFSDIGKTFKTNSGVAYSADEALPAATYEAVGDAMRPCNGTTGDLEWSIEFGADGNILTIYGNGAMGAYTASSDPPWGTDISSVVFRGEVTEIGQYAFYGCADLNKVTMCDSISKIGKSAFSGCKSLLSMELPKDMAEIQEGTFNGCSSLTAVTMPEKPTAIGAYAFAGCEKLSSIAIPSTVASIGEHAFDGCTSFNSEIPSSVKVIGNEAFYGCTSLENLTVYEGVSYGVSTFDGCTGLKYLYIPAGANLSADMFNDCAGLCSVDLPADLSNWQDYFGTTSVMFLDKNLLLCRDTTPSQLPAGVYHTIADQYAFLCWCTSHTPCNGEEYYTDTYHVISYTYCSDCGRILSSETMIRAYHVTFQYIDSDGNPVVMSSTQYDEGTPAGSVVVPSIAREPDNYYSYAFESWDAKVADVTSDAVYTATYTASEREYRVNFYMDDRETLISFGDYRYGTPAAGIAVPTPVKEGTSTVGYTFAGWDREIADVTEDEVDYYAVFNEGPRMYTITFFYYDPTVGDYVEKSKQYENGTSASDIEVPEVLTRSTPAYTYSFVSWDKEVADVTADCKYTATYKADLNIYHVTFVFGEKTYTYEYAYGTTADDISVPDHDTYSSGKYTYKFLSWDRDIEGVTGNAVYVAYCERTVNTCTVTFEFCGKTSVAKYNYGTPASQVEVPTWDTISDDQYTFKFVKWDKEVTAVTEDAVYEAEYTQTVNKYTVSYAVNGVVLTSYQMEYGTSADEVSSLVPAVSNYSDSLQQMNYNYTGSWTPEWQDVKCDITYDAVFSASRIQYSVVFESDGKILSSAWYPYGTPAEQIVKPTGITKDDDAQYTYTFTGWDKEVSDVACSVTYKAVFSKEQREYLVSFQVDGKEVSSKSYLYGSSKDLIEVPVPTKESTAQYDYKFSHWSSTVSDVTGNAVYSAVFDEILRYYTVTYMYNGQEFYSQLYAYGTSADDVWQDVDLSFYNDGRHTYEFTGFDREIEAVTGDATYEIKSKENPAEYQVTFIISDASYVFKHSYGTSSAAVSAEADELSKDCSNFKCWDKEFQDVTGDATYTVVFLGSFCVTFMSEGKILFSGEYEENSEIPAQDIPVPAKATDERYIYTFAGWDREVTKVTTSATYNAVFTAEPVVYKVVFVNEGVEVYSMECFYEDAIDFTAVDVPSKSGDVQYSYVFDRWAGDGCTVTGDMTFTAEYRQVLNKYTVSFISDGKILSSTMYGYGTEPSAIEVPGNVTKGVIEGYIFTFTGWDKEISTVTGDAVYTAQFKQGPVLCTIVFQDDDGSVLSSDEYPYGTPASDILWPMTKVSTVRYTYQFLGWDKDVADVTCDATYTASYNRVLNQYVVTFVCGKDVYSATYDYGTLPADLAIPDTDRPSDAQYTYRFTGWDSQPTMVVGNASYLAQYEKTVNQYVVTFVCGDKTVSAKYDYGTPASDIVIPDTSKASTTVYSYSFVKWDQPVSMVTCDATYLAQYQESLNQYTVTFESNGTVLSSGWFYYGTKAAGIAVPEVSDHEDSEYLYEFSGWDSEIVDVDGNAVYHALFNKVSKLGPTVYTVSFVDDSGTRLVTYTDDSIDSFVEPVPAYRRGYSASWPAYTLGGSDLTVNAVYALVVYTVTFVDDSGKHALTYTYEDIASFVAPVPAERQNYSASWAPFRLGCSDMTVTAVYTPIVYTATFVDDSGKHVLTYTCEDTASFVEPVPASRMGYSVSWPAYSLGGSDLTVTAVYTPIVYTATFVDDSGKRAMSYTCEDIASFVAPVPAERQNYSASWEPFSFGYSDMTVTAVYTPIMYTVTFVDDGKVISTAEYMSGTKAADILVPSVSRDSTDDVRYTFIGWDSEISDVYASVTYTAVFERSASSYLVTVVADAGGSVESMEFYAEYGTSIIADGDRISIGDHVFTAVPDAPSGDRTFQFDKWISVSEVTSDCTVIAVFKAVITPAADVSGKASTDVSGIGMEYVVVIPEGAKTLEVKLADGCSVSLDVSGSAGKLVTANILSADNSTKYADASVYEVDVLMDGAIYNGTMKVTVPVKVAVGQTAKVYYVSDSGLVEMKVVSAGDSVTFETGHNSKYAVVLEGISGSGQEVYLLAAAVAFIMVSIVAVCCLCRREC